MFITAQGRCAPGRREPPLSQTGGKELLMGAVVVVLQSLRLLATLWNESLLQPLRSLNSQLCWAPEGFSCVLFASA